MVVVQAAQSIEHRSKDQARRLQGQRTMIPAGKV